MAGGQAAKAAPTAAICCTASIPHAAEEAEERSRLQQGAALLEPAIADSGAADDLSAIPVAASKSAATPDSVLCSSRMRSIAALSQQGGVPPEVQQQQTASSTGTGFQCCFRMDSTLLQQIACGTAGQMLSLQAVCKTLTVISWVRGLPAAPTNPC